MKKKDTYSIYNIKEADPQLEKHRKEVIEKYLEYGITVIQEYIEEGKTLQDLLNSVKRTLWLLKNERAEQIEKELRIHP